MNKYISALSFLALLVGASIMNDCLSQDAVAASMSRSSQSSQIISQNNGNLQSLNDSVGDILSIMQTNDDALPMVNSRSHIAQSTSGQCGCFQRINGKMCYGTCLPSGLPYGCMCN